MDDWARTEYSRQKAKLCKGREGSSKLAEFMALCGAEATQQEVVSYLRSKERGSRNTHHTAFPGRVQSLGFIPSE